MTDQQQQLRFDGRVAIVTGAGAGLGREYALLLASRGAKVIVNDLGASNSGDGASNRAADLVVNEIIKAGGEAVPNYNSVVDGEKIVETAIKHYGRVDIVINNAGILRDRSFMKISEEDWNIIQDVHLKGAFKVTQAAWPYMKKQNFGRIIMTSSTAGMYGNFGQANYSTAKMGLVGLANTLAVEGAKYNIYCNVIIPTAASRLTQGILPDVLFDELKPKLIAPIVAFLCHESCSDNGSYIQSTAGWASKMYLVSGKGCILRKSLTEDTITLEEVKNSWSTITDMNDAKHFNNIAETTGELLEIIENLKEGKLHMHRSGPELKDKDVFKYSAKDLILYALGIGATVKNPMDLKFLYENDSDFSAIPSFYVMPGLLSLLTTDLITKALPGNRSADLTTILHGEQYLEICDNPNGDSTLSTSGTLYTTAKVYDVMDKKSGALVVVNCDSFSEDGRLMIKNQSSIFVIGAGQFGGKKQPIDGVVPTIAAPNRLPDATISYKTHENQAALYRLSGDFNPLHIDPNFSAIAGYKTPILHGLCSLGYSVRAVLAQYANNEVSRFKCVKARFTAPVLPGQTLKIDMWKGERSGTVSRIYFRTNVMETGKEVITGAYVDLKEVKAKL